MANKLIHPGEVLKVLDAVTVAAGSYQDSDQIDLSAIEGYCSLEWHVSSGGGTVKFEVLHTIATGTFHNIIDDVCAAQTSGTGTGGINMDSFEPKPCKAIVIRCTETGTSDPAVVTAYLVAY